MNAVPEAHGGRWTVQLLGGYSARCGALSIDRWPKARALGLLFARLLLEPQRAHSHDELGRWLWPVIKGRKGRQEHDPRKLRQRRLSHKLSELRARLRVPGLPPDLAFIDTPGAVQLNAAAFCTDVQLLEQAWACGAAAASDPGAADPQLLPGWHDAWLDAQRARLAAARTAAASRSGAAQRVPIGAPGESAPVLLAYPDAFFGRDAEVTQLRAALHSHRLVIVSGPGGVGKTRLVAQALQGLSGFDGQYLVPLAKVLPCLPDPAAALFERIRDALQIQPDAALPIERVVSRLSGQRALLVLDNFEQLAGDAALQAVSLLLRRLPRLQLLLTSIRGLEVDGQFAMPLHPLPLPQPGDNLRAAACNLAVALFIARASDPHRGFKLTARNRAALIDACRALDGLPLAIELAAGRARSLPPHAVAAALRRDLGVFARNPARARQQPRHGSLQAVLDWTWSLLDPAQRRGLVELACCHGSFTATQVEALIPAGDAAVLLKSLQRDSVLRAEPAAPGVPRWRLPEVIRHDALLRSRQPEWAAVADAARRRHEQLFLALATDAGGANGLFDDGDVPDLLVAAGAALDGARFDAAVHGALALARHGARRGTAPAVLDWLQQAVQTLPPTSPGQPELRLLLPRLLIGAGRAAAAIEMAEQALAQVGDAPASLGEALMVHTLVRWMADQDSRAALEPAQRAVELLRPSGQRSALARAWVLLGAVTLTSSGQFERAAAHFREAESLYLALHDAPGVLLARAGLAACHLFAKDFVAAVELGERCEREAAALGDVPTRLQMCNRIAEGLTGLKRWRDALAAGRRLVHLARSHGHSYHTAYGLWNQCEPLARLHQAEMAGLLMGFSRRYWESNFGKLTEPDKRYIKRVRQLALADCSLEAWRSRYDKGRLMDDDEGIRLGCA